MAIGAHVPVTQEAMDKLLRSEANGDAHIPHVIYVIPTKDFEISGSLEEGRLIITRKEGCHERAAEGEGDAKAHP